MPFIPLNNGMQTEVDDIDFMFLLGFSIHWNLNDNYVTCSRRIKGVKIQYFMHKIVAERMGLDTSNQVDHRNRNTLNNKRNNLRPATASQNKANCKVYKNNKLGIKGVRIQGTKFLVQMRVDGTTKHFGCYNTLEEAIDVRNRVFTNHHGEFVSLE